MAMQYKTPRTNPRIKKIVAGSRMIFFFCCASIIIYAPLMSAAAFEAQKRSNKNQSRAPAGYETQKPVPDIPNSLPPSPPASSMQMPHLLTDYHGRRG